MTDTDKVFMEELKLEFIESVTANMAEMPALLAANKFEEIAKIAHDIKGTSGIFGLDEGTDIAKELQYSAQAKDLEKTERLIAELTSYMRENGIIK